MNLALIILEIESKKRETWETDPNLLSEAMWPSVMMVLLVSKFTLAADSFSVRVPTDPLFVKLGKSVILPCSLSHPIGTEGLEVRWYRPDSFNKPVLHYIDHQVQQTNVHPGYSGRASLVAEGMINQTMSLRLEDVTMADAGEFKCFVSSNLDYDTGTVHLSVTVWGTPPLLSGVHQGDMMNASCMSQDWSPQPTLAWYSSQKLRLPPRALKYSSDSQGLSSVSSWILASPSDSEWLSCTVSQFEEEVYEARLQLSAAPPGPWKAAFISLTLITLLVLSITLVWLFIRKRNRDNRQKLLTDKDLKNMREAAVDITLNTEKDHPYLTISADKKTVREQQNIPNISMNQLNILGKDHLSSSSAYWEVELKAENTELKKSWRVGLATESANLTSDVPCPSNGFWVLSSDHSGFYANTDKPIALPVELRPEKLGVFFDNENALSFYNVEKRWHIYTFFLKLTENVYPLFNPGQGDKSPLRISKIDPLINLSFTK